MKIVQFSTRRRVTVTMVMLAAAIFGAISFSKLPIDLLPDITYPTLTIRTEYPGTAPGEVENLISKPIEEAVGVVSGVVRVSSISRPGISDVIVEFEWDTNMDFASLDVREKLDLVMLPRDAEKPVLLRYDPSLDPIMRIGLFGEENLMALRIWAEEVIKDELEGLEGVAAVKVSGGLEEEIWVEVNEAKLASLGIPIAQVINRLSQENINLTGGTLRDGEAEYLVRTLNQFQTVDEIRDIVIGYKNRAPITLSDVSKVSRGFKERKVITRIDGRESVEIAIYKEADANTVGVANRVTKKLKGLQNLIAGTSRMEVVTDQSIFIKHSVDEVLKTALYGGFLAMIILYFFLGNLRSTAIISLAIPLSVITTFFFMFISHVTLNIMSLGGLALGIGMLVDSSIVVLESVDRYRQKGYSVLEAANRGASEVGKAVTAATLTTVCVFVPIIFVKGIAGQLFKDQALAVTYSLLVSLLVALTLIPMFSSLKMELKEEAEEERKPHRSTSALRRKMSTVLIVVPATVLRALERGALLVGKGIKLILWPFYFIFDKVFTAIRNTYPSVIIWALTHKAKMILGAVALFALALVSVRFLGQELIPEMSQGEFIVDVKLPVGTPLEQTDKVLQEMVRTAQRDKRIRRVYAIAGSSIQTGASSTEERENLGQLKITLKKGILRKAEEKVMNDLRRQFNVIAGIEHKFSRPAYFSFKTPIEVEIKGYNLRTLKSLSKQIAARLREIPGLTDIKSSTEGGNPEIQIIFNRRKVAALGMDIGTIANVIRNKVQGEVATEFNRRDRKIDIRVRAREQDRRTIDNLKRLIVNPAGEVPISLLAVANVKLERGPSEIRRVDQEREAVVMANIEGRDLKSVVRDIHKVISQLNFPPDFSVTIGGQNQEMAVSFASMRFAIFLAVFLVYLVMASQFESLLHPFVIMFTIPFGLIGVVFTLLITGQTISVVVLIGLIMLAGIVVNNAIVLVDYINHLRRVEGMPKFEAIVEAGKVRLRPILMTTATTVLGLLPMALGLGEGAEVRAPIAITVIGGLISATILTLVLVPTVYAVMARGK